MRFGRRKMEDDRKALAGSEAATRRATDVQVLEGRGAPHHRLERAPGPADAQAVLADLLCRCRRAVLVSVGEVSSLPHHAVLPIAPVKGLHSRRNADRSRAAGARRMNCAEQPALARHSLKV